MRAVEFALLVVFQVVLIGLGYMFISQALTAGDEENLTVQHEGVTYEVPVLRDEQGNIRPATTEEDVENLILRNLPGNPVSFSDWFEDQMPDLP